MMLYKVKAGALQFIMFIVVVIALLLATFIILTHTHKQFSIKADLVLETINNANRGIDYILQNNVKLNDTLVVKLEDEDYKTLKIYRDYWGLFEKITASSHLKTNNFRKIALIGAIQPSKDRMALYMEDLNRPLVVVGNTKIQGLAYLPKQGVRTGNISGHSYYGSQLINGTMKTSKELPEILKETLEQFETVQNKIDDIDSKQFLDLGKTRKHQNSFLNPLQVIYSNADITLSEVSLIGHIIVQSKTKITVNASSKLKDIILIAPRIEIENHLKGTFQAIATEEIIIGENCTLNYPSAFVLNEEINQLSSVGNRNNIKETPFIKIKKGTKIKGVIVYLGKIKNYKAQVFIDENTTITGEIYCNRNLELLGSVHGGVITSCFVANQSGSSYQNHLYNASILIDTLPQEYVGLALKNSKKGIAKWLY